MARITISVSPEVLEGLRKVARVERREPRDQAALIIERAVAGKDRKPRPGEVQR